MNMESKKAQLLRHLKRAKKLKRNAASGENSNPFMCVGFIQNDLPNHQELMYKYPLNNVFNHSPNLMPNANQLQSKGKENFPASQFNTLYSHRKDTAVLNDITNCVQNLTADLNQAQYAVGDHLVDGSLHLKPKRKTDSNCHQQCDPLDILRRTDISKKKIAFRDNNNNPVLHSNLPIHEDLVYRYLLNDDSNHCPRLMLDNTQLQSKGKEIFQASQFSNLYSQCKEGAVLNDINNCYQNSTTDFSQAQSTDASIDSPQKRQSSKFQSQWDPYEVLNRGAFDPNLINDVQGQESTYSYYSAETDEEFENNEDDDTTNVNYSHFWNLHLDSIVYSNLGNPYWTCTHCGAIFWDYERLRTSRPSDKPIYSLCYWQGKVQLPFFSEAPTYLMNLLFGEDSDESRHFRDNIRAYNMMFSFTSMGGKIDNKINDGSGRFVYRLSGQNHHRIGSLLPVEGQRPKFAQLYIYDTANEVNNRMLALSTSSIENEYHLDPHHKKTERDD